MKAPELTRRAFLQGAAALTFGLATGARSPSAATVDAVSFSPSALLRIDPDNTVRIIMPHAEMGQGAYTGMAQVLADELDADWARVLAQHLHTLDEAFRHPDWGVIATGASTSITSQWNNLREVGATARAMLVAAAAQRWNVDAASLTTSNSRVIDAAGGRELSYGELTTSAAALAPPASVRLKTADEYRLIGHNIGRLDSVEKASGKATFGLDVQLPGMLSAAIAHTPVFGGRVRSFDATAARAMPGVRAVVEIATGVAVVADSYWQAKRAKDALLIEWDKGDFAATDSATLWSRYSTLAARPGPVFEQRGSIDFSRASTELAGEMRFPFLAHAPMEPLNATVQISDGRCEIWAGTQFQGVDVGNLEALAGVAPATVIINTQWLGGSFGRRAAPHADFLVEAVQIAKASGLSQPIKMVWQREDDIQGGFYRPMVLHRFRIGLDEAHKPEQWQHTVVGASISKGTAFEAAFVKNGIDSLSTEGLAHNQYNVPNVEFALHTTAHAVPVLWLRSEADSHTGPVVETIMNRLAHMAGADPLAYRREILRANPAAGRSLAVLDALERGADWHTPRPPDVFRGIAVHPSFGSVCGYVVELKKTGSDLTFHKVTAAMDCGLVVNPDSVKAQIYSAVAFALSTIIGQQVTIAAGGAVESNFHDYPVARLAQVPDVDVHLVASELDHPTGVGEVGVPPFIPALTAAVFAATGEAVDAFPMVLEHHTFLGA